MNNLHRISKNTFAVVTWDAEWKSFNNSYIITLPDLTVLIDAGKAKHKEILAGALDALGRKPKDVDAILYTHWLRSIKSKRQGPGANDQ